MMHLREPLYSIYSLSLHSASRSTEPTSFPRDCMRPLLPSRRSYPPDLGGMLSADIQGALELSECGDTTHPHAHICQHILPRAQMARGTPIDQLTLFTRSAHGAEPLEPSDADRLFQAYSTPASSRNDDTGKGATIPGRPLALPGKPAFSAWPVQLSPA